MHVNNRGFHYLVCGDATNLSYTTVNCVWGIPHAVVTFIISLYSHARQFQTVCVGQQWHTACGTVGITY